MMEMKPLLVVPSTKPGQGGGHLARCAALVGGLRALGREAYLYAGGSRAVSEGEAASKAAVASETKANSAIHIKTGSEAAASFGAASEAGAGFGSASEPDAAGMPLDLDSREWAFIVLDNFRTSREEFAFWRNHAPLIGIDEGGPYRKRFDFLIDTLPSLPSVSAPNLASPRLLPMPKNRRPDWAIGAGSRFKCSLCSPVPDSGLIRVLVSFGAEDRAALTSAAARALAPQKGVRVTAVFGSLNKTGAAEKAALRQAGVDVLDAVPNLGEHLAEYDLVITHFGLTAFESLYARVPALLVSPTRYHEKLAEAAGFLSAGSGSIVAGGQTGLRRLKKIAMAENRRPFEEWLIALTERCQKIATKYNLDHPSSPHAEQDALAHLLAPAAPHVTDCPICRNSNTPLLPPSSPILYPRFPSRTYRRCPSCGMVYMSRSSAPPIEYAKDYFFDSYKKQYGKTYLEDFPNLVEMGRKRLEHIRGLLKAAPLLPTGGQTAGSSRQDNRQGQMPGPETDTAPPCLTGSAATAASLLDIGCAYGPFLAAARDAGFAAAGFEVAEDAVAYVRDTLGIPCFKVPFPSGVDKAVFADGQFAAITLWYVIEHFEDTGAVLAEIRRLLSKGGVLAFSTPSFEGISARKSRAKFLENSPQDHYTIWKPSNTRKILKRFGFSLKKIVVTGHHPERFPLAGRLLRKKAPALTAKAAEKPDAQAQATAINTQGPFYRALLAISRLFRLGDTFEVYATKD